MIEMIEPTTGLRPADGSDPLVDHPGHYNVHPSGVECIDLVEHMDFNVGNAVKYVFRLGEKGRPVQDLDKAIWYMKRELQRLSADGASMTDRPPEHIWGQVITSEPNAAIRTFYRMVRSGHYLAAIDVLGVLRTELIAKR